MTVPHDAPTLWRVVKTHTAWDVGREGILVNVVPEDVARLVVFLGSAANSNITGETVYEGSSSGRSAHAFSFC